MFKKSKLKVVEKVCNENFSAYYLGDLIIATASKAETSQDFWEVVIINELNEQDVRSLSSMNKPTPNDITSFHNTHFNMKDYISNVY